MLLKDLQQLFLIIFVKLQLLSDLHLEVHPLFVPSPAPGADLLVLAGDIGSYQPGSRLQGPDFGLQLFSPLRGWPTPVLYVPGNHEYDMLDFDDTHQRLREACGRWGITWLDRQTLRAQDIAGLGLKAAAEPVRFIGTTLWTDFDALGPQASQAHSGNAPGPNALTEQLKARKKAYSAANWYLKKTGTTRFGAPMLADQVRNEGLACTDWLRGALAAPHGAGDSVAQADAQTDGQADGQAVTQAEPKTVVVTHFAPSLKSADPRYGLNPGTAGFCNALDDLLPQADLWLHGHLHCATDYRAGRCRVVANPLGYVRKNEQIAFLPEILIEI